MNSQNREPYFGSVRFFKHLILTVIGLLIIIPVIVSIVLGVKLKNLQQDYRLKNLEALEQETELARLQKLAGSDSVLSEAVGVKLNFDPTAWNLTLVNDTKTIPKEFTVELAEVSDGQQVDSRILGDLNNMLSDAEKKGFVISVCSAYRDLEKQQNLFVASVKEQCRQGSTFTDAFYATKAKIALPGKSEHQTGLTVDLTPQGTWTQDDVTDDMEAIKWLKDNCSKYGFILRYPQGKEEITGIEYEPYCYRYVGVEAAEYITQHELTLEEFLELCQ